MINVLFVCTGNICRSPTAEGVFRHLLLQEGLADKITADSAGTHNYHIGEAPDPRSIATAQARGISLDGQYSRLLQESDFCTFDLILAMDRDHLEHLNGRAPSDRRQRVKLFLDYNPSIEIRDVPDPYYGGQHGFELVLDLLEEGSRGLLACIRRDYL